MASTLAYYAKDGQSLRCHERCLVVGHTSFSTAPSMHKRRERVFSSVVYLLAQCPQALGRPEVRGKKMDGQGPLLDHNISCIPRIVSPVHHRVVDLEYSPNISHLILIQKVSADHPECLVSSSPALRPFLPFMSPTIASLLRRLWRRREIKLRCVHAQGQASLGKLASLDIAAGPVDETRAHGTSGQGGTCESK